ncbi:MAG: dUTP diphosphatase [Verrucomicrobiales bacterium]|nr:dUTP diphosphatase [Verrucomicrobiales bacterium]|tara:strand:+ start:41966 stop:42391 length:426 start_codon:yes stop_codon:yes gene_type:complete
MYIKFKKLDPKAQIPSRAHPTDAGIDLVAISKEVNKKYSFIEYGTGLAMEIPAFCVGLLFPRSSVSKTNLMLRNCVGVIDAGYRGEIKLRFSIDNDTNKEYDIQDKIGQLLVFEIPFMKITEDSNLSDSDRGDGGFGSTDI